MSFIDIRNSIVYALANHIKTAVRRESQTTEETPFPYVLYSVLSPYSTENGLGNFSWKKDGDSVTEKRKEHAFATFSFTACSTNRTNSDGEYISGDDESCEIAQKIYGFFTHVGTLELSRNGIAVVEVGNTTSRSFLFADETDIRYGLDIKIRYEHVTEKEVGMVEKVNTRREPNI